jgi:PAS domain S-box-containing protein
MSSDASAANYPRMLDNFLLQQTEEVAQLGSYSLDLETGRAEYSDNLFRLYGLAPQSIEPTVENIIEMVHPDDREKLRAFRDRMRRTEDTIEPVEYRIRRTDGVERCLRVKAMRLVIAPDQHRYIAGFIQDVTEEVGLRQQAEQRRRFVELLIDSSVDRMLALDRELRLTAWNRVCEEQFGIRREALLGKSFLEAFPRVRETPSAMDAIHRALAGETVTVRDEPGLYSTSRFDLYYTPIRDERGEVEGVLCTAHDVTERLRAEEQLKALNRALERQNEALQRSNRELAAFNYVATHDLREPLRKIQTFAQVIERREADRLSTDGAAQFARLRESAERMEALMDGLRHLGSLSSGDSAPTAAVDLGPLFGQVRADFSQEIAALGAVVEAGALPVVPGQATQLRQLFVELLDNALKFQPAGQAPRVSIRTVEADAATCAAAGLAPDRPYCRVEVEDNGIGFEREYTDRIFQLFQRLHDQTSYGGIGIGLAICKKIAENHGGTVTAESTPGQGAVFTVFLPL